MQTGFQGTCLVAASIAQRTSDMISDGLTGLLNLLGFELNRIAHLNGKSFTASDAAQTTPTASASRARLRRSRPAHL
jgi:hypothetical protein